MTELQAYNLCLQAVSQAAINTISVADPDVAEIANHLAQAKRSVLQMGWLFNTDTVDLEVDGNSKVSVAEYLKVYLPDGLTVRGGYVWQPETSSYYDQDINSAQCVVDVAWTDIPEEGQQAIAHKAAVSYLMQIKRDDFTSLQLWQMKSVNRMAALELLYPTDYGDATGGSSVDNNLNI